MVFIYHSIFTNAHKSYVYKVINKKSARIYTILFSFNMKSKNKRALSLIFYLYFHIIWVSHKILTKKDVTFIIWGKHKDIITVLKEKK